MASVELATAYISLAPSARGIVNAIERELSGGVTSAAANAGDNAGATLGDHLHRGLAGKIAGITTLLAGVGGVALGVGLFKGAIDEATQAQKVIGQTGAVIKSTGDASGLSADQFSAMATRLSDLAGVDDEVIQQGENVLATFTNIKTGVGDNDIFGRATADTLDMSKAMGMDLQSAVVQVGKALQDPVEGVSALQRVGVRLTDQQKEQAKAFVAGGDAMSAQKLILGELEKEFGGVAAATATPMEKMQVQFKNMLESLGTALAPAIAALAPAFGQLLTALAPVLTALGSALAPVLAALAPVIVALAPPVAQIITILGQLLVPVASLLVALAPIAALILQLAGAFLGALLPAITPLINVLVQVVGQIATALRPVIAEIVPIIAQNAGAWGQLVQSLLPILPALGQLIIALLPILPPLIELISLQFKLLAILAPVIGFIAQLAAILITGLAKGISEVVGWISNSLVPWFTKIPGAVLGALEAVGRFISEGIQKFLDFGGKVIEKLTELPGKMFQIGVDAAESIGKGLWSLIGKLSDIAGKIKDKLVDTLNPANWFSTPEEHYRMLWGAAFGSIGDEARRNLLGVQRSVAGLTRAATPVFTTPHVPTAPAFSLAPVSLPEGSTIGTDGAASPEALAKALAGIQGDVIMDGDVLDKSMVRFRAASDRHERRVNQ